MKNLKLYLHFFLLITFLPMVNSQNQPLKSYEGYYLKQNTYPDDDTNWWMYNGLEVQGVTHDDDNWYFALTEKSGDNGILRRIPRSVPLAGSSTQPSNSGIKVVTMNDVPELSSNNFWHWGDPDHYRYNGVDYILVPIPASTTVPNPVIACFRANDLEYINYANLSPSQNYAGWCAIGVDGDLYGSNNHATKVLRYDIDWENFINTNNHNVATLINEYSLQDNNGNTMELLHMQGGEFSPSGELLYIVCGSAGCLGFGPGQPEPSDGIHVFETVNWKEVKRSTNTSGGTSHFNYTFDNNCTCAATGSQSPEGLTIWDLDDGSVPNITGQLHVLVDHYNTFFCDDAVTFQHFSGNIYIDKVNGVNPSTNPLTGSESHPFKTFNEAFNFYPIWDGAQIIIKAGTYSDIGTYTTRVCITSKGGSAIIGQ